MKRFKILMAAAIVFGTASAFTVQSVAMEDIYVETSPGHFELLTDVQNQGNCEQEPNANCEYILNASDEFEAIDTDRMWKPL